MDGLTECVQNKTINSELSYLKYRNDELNRELIDKLAAIKQLEEQNKNLENSIENYKKHINKLNEKTLTADNLAVELSILKKSKTEIEEQLSLLKKENFKLHDTISKKDSIIRQFEELVELSQKKFKAFDETNNILRLKIEELTDKRESISQHKSCSCLSYEAEKKKTEELESQCRMKLKLREDQFRMEISRIEKENENLKLEVEKSRLENRNTEKKLEDLKNSFKLKELEHNFMLETKDQDYEKLKKNLKEFQKEFTEVEENYNNLMTTMKKKSQSYEDEISDLRSQLNKRSTELDQMKLDKENLNNVLKELNKGMREFEATLNTKNTLIQNLRTEVHNKQMEMVDSQANDMKEIELLRNKLNILEREKEILFNEKDETQKEILNLREKCLEYENRRSDLTRKYDEEMKYVESFQLKEDQYFSEISRLQNIIIERDEERDAIRNKLEKKIHYLKINLEEAENRIYNLIQSMISFKEYALTVESNLGDPSSNESYNPKCLCCVENNRYWIDALRELISKMDCKINSMRSLDDFQCA